VCNARNISPRGVDNSAGGGGRQRSVPGHRRASLLDRHQQMRVTPGYPESTHCQERFRNPPFLHAAVVCTQSNASDGHQSNIPERATGRRTSPIVHAYPTPHRGKTPCRPALHASTRTPTSYVCRIANRTRPTDASHPWSQATVPLYPCRCPGSRRSRTPHERVPHVGTDRARTPSHGRKVGPGNRGFCIWQPCVRDSGNKNM